MARDEIMREKQFDINTNEGLSNTSIKIQLWNNNGKK